MSNKTKSSNRAIRKVFETACRTGETNELAKLIVNNEFDVNNADKLQWAKTESMGRPLAIAVRKRSLPVAKLLLDHGANRNSYLSAGGKRKTILSLAVECKELYMVMLLLNYGANVASRKFKALRSALELSSHESKESLEIILESAVSRVNNNKSIEKKIRNYILFAEAIVKDDAIRVAKILEGGTNNLCLWFTNLRELRPEYLSVRFAGSEVLKSFVRANIEVDMIFCKAAAAKGNIELLEFCLMHQPCYNNYWNLEAMRAASSYGQIEAVKLLITKYGIKFSGDPDMLRKILEELPKMYADKLRQSYNPPDCKLFRVLLEHFGLVESRHEDCFNRCEVVQYLEKLLLIDQDYVTDIIPLVLGEEHETKFEEHVFLNKIECLDEITKMQNIRISQGTTAVIGKTLLDVIYFNSNNAAKYSRNEVLLKIYEDNDQDFQIPYPNYGFALNRQLRRGTNRRIRLESAMELLYSALGVGLPQDLAELIFGFFTNQQLEQFVIEVMEH